MGADLSKEIRFRSRIKIALSVFVLLQILACSSSVKLLLPKEEGSSPHLLYESDLESDYLIYEGFVVHFNAQYKIPDYTLHRIDPQQLQDSNGRRAERLDKFWVDERLATTSAKREDYFQSGYDRGHHVPAGDFVYSQHLKDETFTYSNVSPQFKELNRYGWKYVEMAIRNKVENCACTAYVVTGSLVSEEHKYIGEGKVAVPAQLYKIAFYPSLGKMYAFLMKNNSEAYQKPLKGYQTTVDELEQLSAYDFFERLADEEEEKLESKIKTLKRCEKQNY